MLLCHRYSNHLAILQAVSYDSEKEVPQLSRYVLSNTLEYLSSFFQRYLSAAACKDKVKLLDWVWKVSFLNWNIILANVKSMLINICWNQRTDFVWISTLYNHNFSISYVSIVLGNQLFDTVSLFPWFSVQYFEIVQEQVLCGNTQFVKSRVAKLKPNPLQ